MTKLTFLFPAVLALTAFASHVHAAPYARAGWQATLSTNAHNTHGIVTIVDADTFRVDNFFYDGGGINVHFIVAASNTNPSFVSDRIVTEPNFLGTVHTGDSVTIDLPSGTTLDGRNAVSLWCVPAGANFGSGTFAVTPEPATLAACACLMPLARRRR